MSVHLATMLEALAGRIGDETALRHGDLRRSYRELDERSSRLAHALAGAGLGVHSKVAILSLNRPEWIEALYAAFKIGGVPVNVNYRYAAAELRYLLDNADAEAVVFEARYAPMLGPILQHLPQLRLLVEIEDESTSHLQDAELYEDAIAEHAPLAPIAHGPDEIYMFYTGGTTGMPKGVVWRHTDFVDRYLPAHVTRYADLGLKQATSLEECLANIDTIRKAGRQPVMIVACPLMHGVGLWGGVVAPLTQGGTVITLPGIHFDAHELWRTVEQTRANSIVIVGDAFAKPMLQALEEAEAAGRPFDITSLKRIGSSGVMWSHEVKQGLLARHDMELIDTLGSTEAGGGVSITTRASPTPTARFAVNPTTRVVTDDGKDVEPGSDVIGAVISGGVVPLDYYKDPEKSARTFRTIDGTRYTMTGDFARVEADGTITLLGRGSQCINTGGEKVFPEEIEEALKRHPAVRDCLVVGVPDPRFGEKVAAVLSTRSSAAGSDEELVAFVREQLAGYKVPRLVVRVPDVRRAPNGKADYAWAKETARTAEAANHVTPPRI